MTLAQVVLTPTESKKLIAMALAEIDVVKRAVDYGMIVLNPSSSTYFIVEAITGQRLYTNAWVCGMIVPRGACVEVGELTGMLLGDSANRGPATFKNSWVIREGKLTVGTPLGTLLDEMGPDDVYIKGVNAIDPDGNVGCLVGDPIANGTIGLVTATLRKKNFNLIFPVGLEKLIPIPVRQAAKEAKRASYTYGMGVATSLFSCPEGMVITEPKAIEILSGATAIPMAAGGLGGAEGAVTLLIKGNDDQVNEAIKHVERSKGARLPQVRTWNCHDCSPELCTFPLIGKHWVTT